MYLQIKLPQVRDPLSKEQLAKFKRGIDVGKFAKLLFENGVDCTPSKAGKTDVWIEKTLKSLNEHSVLFEAAFAYGQNMAIMDIIEVHQNQLHAFEVKSSLKVSPVYELDLAYQSYIIQKSTERLEKVHIIHVNPDYLKEDDSINWKAYFKVKDYSNHLPNWLPWVEEQSSAFFTILEKDEIPKQSIGKHCFEPYTCDFIKFCWKRPIQDKWNNAQAFLESHSSFLESKGLLAKNRLSVNLSFPFDVVFYIRPAIPVLIGSKPYEVVPLAILRFYSQLKSEIIWQINQSHTQEEVLNEMNEAYSLKSNVQTFDSLSSALLNKTKSEQVNHEQNDALINGWQTQFRLKAEQELISNYSLKINNLSNILDLLMKDISNELNEIL